METFDHHAKDNLWHTTFYVQQAGMFFLTKWVWLDHWLVQGAMFLFSDPFSFTKISPLSIPSMIALSSIYGDIFPATLDGGYSVGGGGRLVAIIVGGHDQK